MSGINEWFNSDIDKTNNKNQYINLKYIFDQRYLANNFKFNLIVLKKTIFSSCKTIKGLF